MTDDEKKQLVLQYLDAGRSGEPDKFRAVLHPDVVMWMPKSASEQFGRDKIEGVETFITFAGEPIDQIYGRDSMKWTIHRSVVDGDFVWTHASLSAVTPRGVPYDNLYFILVRIQDGQIGEIWESIDTAYAYEIFNAESPEALAASKAS